MKCNAAAIVALSALQAVNVSAQDSNRLDIALGGRSLLSFQAAPMTRPAGGDRFRASDFIHPLNTPSGFTVTQIQPKDHLHHLGLWWPWKYVVAENRKILFWEMQENDGIIEAQNAIRTEAGFTATSSYIDRRAPAGPRTILKETVTAMCSAVTNVPANGYFLDLAIVHENVLTTPVTVLTYRYSGFSLRATHLWNKGNSTVLTSDGKDRDSSNGSTAKWVLVQGQAPAGGSAGILLMSAPANPKFPERLRTWDSKTENGAVFINFNPVQAASLTIEPGRKLTRHYRAFVYDGTVTHIQAETLWSLYAQGEPGGR